MRDARVFSHRERRVFLTYPLTINLGKGFSSNAKEGRTFKDRACLAREP